MLQFGVRHGIAELTADQAFELPETLARIEVFDLVRAPRFSVPFGK
jgi:hypothetical protein